MKIGLSTSVIQRGQTGIGQYVLALTAAFLDHTATHKFTLFVLQEDLPLFEFAGRAMQIVPVSEAYRSPVKNIAWHQLELPRLARSLQLDVLHIPSYRRLLWRRPCPAVATIHDLAPFKIPKKYDWKRMFYGRVVASRLVRRLDEVIAISHSTARDIEEFFRFPADRITVIHNGLAHDRFHPASREQAKAEMAARHGLAQPFFLYLARLEHPGKNHVRLVEAFNRLKADTQQPWQLVFAGSDWHGAEAIHACIRQSPFHEDIRCLGFVPDTEIPSLLRAAEVFVYPSLYEGFGLPPLEAMASGCPVISSTRGGLKEVLGEAAATVEPEDVAGLKWQMSRLAGDPGLRERLRRDGLVRAQQFNWQKAAAATLAVYRRAASRPGILKAIPQWIDCAQRRSV